MPEKCIVYLVLLQENSLKARKCDKFSLANEKRCGIIILNGCWYVYHILLAPFIQFDTICSTGPKIVMCQTKEVNT